MKSTKVYDVPTRLFHWLFAAVFLSAFFIAKAIDDDSPNYVYHMLGGLLLVLLVGLRIAWGFFGSKYARFSSFNLRPSALIQYFADLVTGKTKRTLGHNPASSWAALIMMGLALGLGLTGYLMTSGGNKELWEDLHELLANSFILVVLAHIAGIVLHMLRHQDGIALGMVHGNKQAVEGQAGIERSHLGIGIVMLAIVGAFVFHLNKSYDQGTQTLNLFGATLQLGESENEHHLESGDTHEKSGNDDDRDDDD